MGFSGKTFIFNDVGRMAVRPAGAKAVIIHEKGY